MSPPVQTINWRCWKTDPPTHNGYFLIVRLSKFDRREDTLWCEEAQMFEDGPGSRPGVFVSDGDMDSPIDDTEILYWADLPGVPNPRFQCPSS